jgi:hypothetical protein
MPPASVLRPDRTMFLVPSETIRAAGTYVSEERAVPAGTKTLAVLAKFARAAGGTTLDVFVQTSLDGGQTWMDIMNLTFATTTANQVQVVKTDIAVAPTTAPVDGALADDTILDGVLGDRIRVKQIVVGTYTGASTLEVSGVFN